MFGCKSSPEEKDSQVHSEENKIETVGNSSEKLNETVPFEESVMLIGKVNRRGLQMSEFSDWFLPGYEEYSPNPEVLEKLEPLMDEVAITLFMGTWCEDSHRDVPHLYKILDAVNFDESNMEVYAVSEDKTTPEGFENGKNILQVPTIIFYKDGKEQGRIVEYSIFTLEQDMLDILSGRDYKNPYSE